MSQVSHATLSTQARTARCAPGQPGRRWFQLAAASSIALALVGLILISAASVGRAAPMATIVVAFTQASNPVAPGPVAPSQQVRYTVTIKNNSTAGEVLQNVRVTDTFPSQLQFIAATTPHNRVGNVIVWTPGDMAVGAERIYTITAQLPVTGNVLHDQLRNTPQARWTGLTTPRAATPSNIDLYVSNALIAKPNTTAISTSVNLEHQAVAGEQITATVFFTIPQGTIAYTATPRILLEDGISVTGASEGYTLNTNQITIDPQKASGRRFTQLQFAPRTFADTAGASASFSYTVYAVQRQNRPLGTLPSEIPTTTNLLIQPILRWCPGPCAGVTNHAYYYAEDETLNYAFVRPSIVPAISSSYPDAPGIGKGGGQVRFDIVNKNQGAAPAYNVVFTATLGPGLALQAASPTPYNWQVVGGVTIISWTAALSVTNGSTWLPNRAITATMPNPLVVGDEFTCTAQIHYETYSETVLYEGVYTAQASQTLKPGALSAKSAAPVKGNLTVGDKVNYTVVLTQGAGTYLRSPRFTDTLPLGYHLSGTVTSAPAAASNVLVGASGLLEQVGWSIADQSPATQQVIVATYVAENTGLDANAAPVYASSSSDLNTAKPSINSAQLHWSPLPTIPNSSLVAASAQVSFVQPYLGASFSTARADTTGDRNVGEFLDFDISFRNSGKTEAHDVVICDRLPQGIVFYQMRATPYTLQSAPGCTPAVVKEPTLNDNTPCWYFNPICVSTGNNTLRYTAKVEKNAIPGGPYKNYAYTNDYSSQPGGTNDGNANDNDLPAGVRVDRHYNAFPIALASAQCPTAAGKCPFNVKGLAAKKTAQQAHILPGDYITYVLTYSDTSNIYNYTNLVITDTYDANLEFRNATPSPTSHDQPNRRLVWNLAGAVPSTKTRITVTLQAKALLDPPNATVLTNTMQWYGTASDPNGQQVVLTQVYTTSVGTPIVHVKMTGPGVTHAGDTITYTVTYSNTGGADAVPARLTFTYAPYLIYDGYTSAEGDLTKVADNIFDDAVLPKGGAPYVLYIRLKVKAPLPYTTDSPPITSSVQIATAGALPDSDQWVTTVQRPKFTFSKHGPYTAPPVGSSMKYTFTLANTGDFTATNLVITDTWDPATSWNSGVSWTNHGSYATYAIASLAPGASATVNELWVNVVGDQTRYVNTATLTSLQTTALVDVEKTYKPSIAIVKSVNPDPAFPGRPVTYTIYFTNTYAGSVPNAVITDTLPAGFTFSSQARQGDVCQIGETFQVVGQKAIWKCAVLKQGAQGRLYLVGTVSGAEGSTLTNNAESDGEGIPLRSLEEPLITRVARPWLSVVKTADTRPAAPGDQVTYTLTYSNYNYSAHTGATDPAYHVTITDRIPANATFVRCSPNCTFAGGVATWDLDTVPNDGLEYQAILVVRVTGASGQSITNADYTIQSQRLSPADTSAGPDVVIPILNPHLALVKTAEPIVVTAASAPITYTLYYTNDGGGTLHNIVITDTLSNSTVFVSASAGCTHNGAAVGGVVTCRRSLLEATHSGSFKIRVASGALNEGAEITNQVRADADEIGLTQSNTTSVWFYSGGCLLPVDADFTYTPAAPNVGETVTFTGSVRAGEPPIVYTWSLGDGATATGQQVSHAYTSGGAKTVIMTATNSCAGGVDSVQKTVTVAGGPVIGVSPLSVSLALHPGETATRTVTIENTGAADLNWTLAEDPAVDWLSESSAGGTILPAGQAQVVLSFAAPTTPGPYSTTLQITSNAPTSPVSVQVNLTVAYYRIYLPLVVRNAS